MDHGQSSEPMSIEEAGGIAVCLEACGKSRGQELDLARPPGPPPLAPQTCQTPPGALRACRGHAEVKGACEILSRNATGAPEAWGSPPCVWLWAHQQGSEPKFLGLSSKLFPPLGFTFSIWEMKLAAL